MKVLEHVVRQGLRAAAVAVATIGFASTAWADPITFLPSNTNFSIKFIDREIVIVPGVTELFGIFNITQINNAAGTTTFWNGNGVSDGTQLVGFFQGLIPIANQDGPGGLSFSGGTISVFDVPNGCFNPTFAPNTKNFASQLNGGTGCSGALPPAWLTGNFVPGINDGLLTPPRDATLQAAIATTNVQAGFGYISVAGGGANNAFFDTNGFNFMNFGPADLFLRSNFVLATPNTCPVSSGWQVCSDDPIIAKSVPEPGTLTLLALAALAAGGIRRKKAAGL